MTLSPVLSRPTVLGRWDPLREFDDLQDRMSQLMASVFGPSERANVLAWTPLADVTETEDAYLVEIDAPGVKREDITVEITSNELAISGECRPGEQPGTARSRSRRIGRFEYRTVLPGDIDSNAVSAELAEGVLTVRVPKSEAAKPRRIAIESH